MPTLTWIGKDAVVNHHKEVPFHLLSDDPKRSVGEDSGNLLVQGDNLLVLKALLPHYAGKVKCIYIDPPYNTGNENWVYNDAVNSPEMRNWLGKVVGGEAEDLSRHDKWLCMMYPRLHLLWQFLRIDGSLWISIDDSELPLLRLLMDEIAGHEKFIACNVWQKRYSRENREAIGDVHEYIVIYAKDPESFKSTRNRIPADEKSRKVYKNPNNDPHGPWRAVPMNAQGYRPNQMYPITTPMGVVHHPPKGRCWSMIEPEYLKLLGEGRIYFGKTGKSQPNVIRYLSEVNGFVPWTWWPHTEVGHTDEAKKEINSILDKANPFDTPKPVRLMRRILQIATNPNEKEIILDSFAGSGTTGHAVLKQNAEDGGNRHFILIEMDENVCQNITSERLRRVALGYTYKDQKGNEKQEAGLGGGFRYCELGETLFDAQGQIRKEVTFANLARHVYFTETGQPLPEKTRKQWPLLGVKDGLAVYLLYNGILKDKSAGGGNVLTRAVLASLPAHEGPKVIYGNGSLFSESKLRELNISFRQVPYEIKVN
jgi:site-specific DNA-methyltransferase (adenine-specific)/adenine-specific DNA-methyltransferase